MAWGCPTSICASNVVALSAGDSYTLLLKSDRTVAACGTWPCSDLSCAFNGAAVAVPPGLSNVVATAAGWNQSLALKEDGTVVGWTPIGVETNLPTTLTNVVAISAGVRAPPLALKADGTVSSWGGATTNTPPGLTNVVAVAAGSGSLALKADGTLVAWGDWLPGRTNSLSDLTNVVAISAGMDEWLALKADGTVGGGGFYEVPPGLSNIVVVASSPGGDHHMSMALKSDGSVVAWGFDFCGGGYVLFRQLDTSDVVAIAAGGGYELDLVGGGKPFLLSRLVDRAVIRQGAAYFYAQASGEWPLAYQWRFNDSIIPGATNCVLALTNVQPEQAGQYSVMVSNGWGTSISNEAVLAVVPILISTPPQDQITFAGGAATFTTVAQGRQPLSYQWTHDGEVIDGATNSALRLDNVQISQAGHYAVRVSNVYGATTSADGILTVPQFSRPPNQRTRSHSSTDRQPLRFRCEHNRRSPINGM